MKKGGREMWVVKCDNCIPQVWMQKMIISRVVRERGNW